MPDRHEAADRLVTELRWVRALARAVTRDPWIADDVAQEAAATWLAATAPPTTHTGLRAWLRTFVTLATRAGSRSTTARRRRERLIARPEAEPSTLEVVARCTALRRVAEAVERLDEPYRTAIVLRYVDGLSHRAIAERTGLSEAAVRKRVSRGLTLLRRRLVAGRDRRAVFALPGAELLHRLPPAVLPMSTKPKIVAAAGLLAAGVFVATDPRAPAAPAPLTSSALDPMRAAGAPAAPVRVAATVPDAALERTPVAPAPPDAAPAPQPPAPSGAPPTDAERLVLWAPPSTAPCAGASVAGSCVSCHGAEAQELRSDGFHTVTDLDGLMIVEGRFVLGKRTGPFVEYHANGAVAARGEYFAGKRHGAWSHYRDDGSLAEVGGYVYGHRDGVWRSFAPGGRLTRLAEYRNGMQHGVDREFAPDGTVLERRFYYGVEDEDR